MNIELLNDSICDNFMKAVNHGPWAPFLNSDGIWTTFCNYFVGSVAKEMGYYEFWPNDNVFPKLANEIHSIMLANDQWMKETDGQMAQYHANQGALVLASQQNSDGHGHVCVVRPGHILFSGKWNKSSPRVANVGKDVFIDKHCAFAFQTEPDYFCLISSLKEK